MSNNNVGNLFDVEGKVVETFWDDKINVGKFTRRGDRVYMTIVDMRNNTSAAIMSQKNLKELISNLQELVTDND